MATKDSWMAMFAEDKLPQPFRRVDKLLNELIDATVRYCDGQEAIIDMQKQLEALPRRAPRHNELYQRVRLCALSEQCCVLLHADDTASILDLGTSSTFATLDTYLLLDGALNTPTTAGSSLLMHTAAADQAELQLEEAPSSVTWSPDGSLLAVCSNDSIALFRCELDGCDAKQLAPLHCHMAASSLCKGTTEKAKRAQAQVVWQWDTHATAADSMETHGMFGWQLGCSTLQLWSIQGGTLLSSAASAAWSLPGFITSSSQSEDGSSLALGLLHGAISLWDCKLGIPLTVVRALASSVVCCAFSLSSGRRQVIAVGADGAMVSVDAQGSYQQRVVANHCAAPSAIFLPKALEGCAVLVGAQPWRHVPLSADVLVFDLQSKAFVGKIGPGGWGRDTDVLPGCKESALLADSPHEAHCSSYTFNGSTLVRVTSSCQSGEGEGEGAEAAGSSRVEVIGLEDALRGQPRAAEGNMMVQRFLDDVEQKQWREDRQVHCQQPTAAAQGPSTSFMALSLTQSAHDNEEVRVLPQFLLLLSTGGGNDPTDRIARRSYCEVAKQLATPQPHIPATADAQLADTLACLQPRRQSWAGSVSMSGGAASVDNDRASTLAPVRVPQVPQDALEAAALRNLMEAIALRCGGRRRRERKVGRTMCALAAELAKESNYSRTGLGLVLQM